MAIARFSIAVDRRFKRQGDQDSTDFFNCTAFGKTGEFVGKYFHKGSRILISGRIQNDNYTNKNGEKVYAVQIIAEEVEFADSKNSQSQSGDSTYEPQNAAGMQGLADAGRPEAPAEGFMNIPDAINEELPFN